MDEDDPSKAELKSTQKDLLTETVQRLRYVDDIQLWRLLPSLNPSSDILDDLVSAYQNFFLDAYLNSNLGPGCNLEAICDRIN